MGSSNYRTKGTDRIDRETDRLTGRKEGDTAGQLDSDKEMKSHMRADR